MSRVRAITRPLSSLISYTPSIPLWSRSRTNVSWGRPAAVHPIVGVARALSTANGSTGSNGNGARTSVGSSSLYDNTSAPTEQAPLDPTPDLPAPEYPPEPTPEPTPEPVPSSPPLPSSTTDIPPSSTPSPLPPSVTRAVHGMPQPMEWPNTPPGAIQPRGGHQLYAPVERPERTGWEDNNMSEAVNVFVWVIGGGAVGFFIQSYLLGSFRTEENERIQLTLDIEEREAEEDEAARRYEASLAATKAAATPSSSQATQTTTPANVVAKT